MKRIRLIFYTALEKVVTIRMFVFTVIMLLICWIYNEPIRQCAENYNYPAGIWVFPFMMGHYTFLIMFYFAAIYANADIPFMQYSNMYRLIRMGKRNWAFIQMGMLFLRSFFLVLITVVCSIVTLFPKIDVTIGWGKLLYNLGSGMIPMDIDARYSIYYEAMIHWTPVQIMCLSVLISTCIVFLLALFMFLISLWFDRILAITGAAALDFLLFFVLNTHPKIRNQLAIFVPTIWPQIVRLYTPDMGYFWLPSIKYMISVIAICTLIVGWLVILRMKKIEIHWRNEDI